MELLAILLSIALVIAVGATYMRAIDSLNAYSETHYKYRPITVPTVLFAIVPWLVVVAGFAMGNDNLVVGILAAGILLLILASRIAHKSSTAVALASIPLLVIAGAGVIVVALLIAFVLGRRKEDKTRSA